METRRRADVTLRVTVSGVSHFRSDVPAGANPGHADSDQRPVDRRPRTPARPRPAGEALPAIGAGSGHLMTGNDRPCAQGARRDLCNTAHTSWLQLMRGTRSRLTSGSEGTRTRGSRRFECGSRTGEPARARAGPRSLRRQASPELHDPTFEVVEAAAELDGLLSQASSIRPIACGLCVEPRHRVPQVGHVLLEGGDIVLSLPGCPARERAI